MTQLQTTLRQLRLSGLSQTLDVRLQEAAAGRLGHGEFLELIFQDELNGAQLDTAPIMEGEPGCASSESGNHSQRKTMSNEPRGPRPLREIELEVEAEGREWTRRRLQQRLQEEADRHGEVFPPQRPAAGPSARPPDATAHDRRRD